MSNKGTVAVALALTCCASFGCQRGCLSSWLGERGVGPAASSSPRALPMGGYDCPDGLVRCHAGVAQASKLGAVSGDCSPTPERPHACDCPFEDVATCAHGCVVEDVTAMGQAKDATRTCALGPLVSPSLAVTGPTPPGVKCEGEAARYHCEQGVVFACSTGGAEPVARCDQGCFAQGEELEDDDVDIRAAAALLCVAHRDALQR